MQARRYPFSAVPPRPMAGWLPIILGDDNQVQPRDELTQLPLAERFDVYLLGTGLPSFWVAQMGEMRLTLGLSGWTVNDWTRSAALDLLAPPAAPAPDTVDNVTGGLVKP